MSVSGGGREKEPGGIGGLKAVSLPSFSKDSKRGPITEKGARQIRKFTVKRNAKKSRASLTRERKKKVKT